MTRDKETVVFKRCTYCEACFKLVYDALGFKKSIVTWNPMESVA